MNELIQITANEQGSAVVHQAQIDLLRLVDEFMKEGETSAPAELISELIDHWLMTPAVDLARNVNPDQLRIVQSLISLLTQLNEDKHGLMALKATVSELLDR